MSNDHGPCFDECQSFDGERSKDPSIASWEPGIAIFPSTSMTAAFATRGANCCSAGSWIVARCRISGSRTRRTARRIARSARRSGSSIRLSSRNVLEGTDSDGLPIRWSFNEMKPDSFVWRGEKSRDGGKTWKLEEEHHMTRRSG